SRPLLNSFDDADVKFFPRRYKGSSFQGIQETAVEVNAAAPADTGELGGVETESDAAGAVTAGTPGGGAIPEEVNIDLLLRPGESLYKFQQGKDERVISYAPSGKVCFADTWGGPEALHGETWVCTVKSEKEKSCVLRLIWRVPDSAFKADGDIRLAVSPGENVYTFFIGTKGDTVARDVSGKTCLANRYGYEHPQPGETWVCEIQEEKEHSIILNLLRRIDAREEE
ncbi:MAG: hypothetical protein ACTSU5_11265, partial [Promethearchaeota archaeon]